MATREEALQAIKDKYINVAIKFLDSKMFDIVKYGQLHDARGYGTSAKWLEFAKENLDKETYDRFFLKVAPFEANEDGSDKEEKERLKEHVANIATKVFQKKANLIDVIDEVTPSVEQFVYMVKLLRFTYKTIPGHVFNKALEFYDRVCRYDSLNVPYTIEYLNLNDKEKETLEQILIDRDLPINDITYTEAFNYALRNQLIQAKPIKSR